jgi:hypothetical protein
VVILGWYFLGSWVISVPGTKFSLHLVCFFCSGAGTKNEDDDETESVPLMADGVMLPTERREASHRRSFVQSIISDAALVMGRAKVQFLFSCTEWNH